LIDRCKAIWRYRPRSRRGVRHEFSGNGKVRRMTPFRRVYVQSAAGMAGGAIGAAFAVWHKLGGQRTFVMDHAIGGRNLTRSALRY